MRKRQRRRKKSSSAFRFIQVFLSLCLLISLAFYSLLVEPNWISVNHLQLTLPHLAAEFEQYRIVQISDIHTDKWMNKEHLSRIFRLVNSQQPDLVAMVVLQKLEQQVVG